MHDFVFGQDRLTIDKIVNLSKNPLKKVAIDGDSLATAEKYRQVVDAAVDEGRVTYGVNTGFGYLSNVEISKEKLRTLQKNLIRSHACGVGDPIPSEMVRGLLILRLHTFLLGYSGVTTETISAIAKFLEKDVLPLVPKQGSVGASGDLAPLAHLALGLMGEGWVHFQGEKRKSADICESEGLAPIDPKAKEGLSLINGTHFSTVVAAHVAAQTKNIFRSADVIAALSLDATCGTDKAFDERIHQARPQPGQMVVARNMRKLFSGLDSIMDSHRACNKVQDPYSFRCLPQVHGACRDLWDYASRTIETELNSVTDNPLCFLDGTIVSGGNFHAQPIAFAMDGLALALSEIGSISERRIEKLINPNMSGLPPFLTRGSGINSGYMIPHVVAASLVSENKVLSHPASVDSIPTSADKEDHVSMAPIAAFKARSIASNVSRILAIELLAGCQGLDLLKPLAPNAGLLAIYEKVRDLSSFMDEDRSLHEDIEVVRQWIDSGSLLDIASQGGIEVD